MGNYLPREVKLCREHSSPIIREILSETTLFRLEYGASAAVCTITVKLSGTAGLLRRVDWSMKAPLSGM